MKTYDVVFNNNESSNDKGFARSIEACKEYIDAHKKLKDSYFEDYAGGTVSIVCNETGETVYNEEVRDF
jgi:hypothetical protein